ncbi:cilia- and flagella-associated protein 100 isoform X2 [Xenopus laevis]|uniref:Cilia- and flagella-associated protein 100 isoform X2 n=2 Tax=Xenopus laevis TaxID=8355 RepID=A0A1L8GYI5_XENLA|nr:cilia- and flagella-associated protein 100 isoform X2 [Xenopus laevis]OCT88866.1 hypothetical protein XELAEV_18017496mg [Xenopus laevis]
MSEENSGGYQEQHDNLQNPFTCPKDFGIFQSQHFKEKNKKENKYWHLKACDQTTLASRERTSIHAKRQTALENDINENKLDEKCHMSTKSDESWAPPITRNFHTEKESLHSYILQNRKMFRGQFAADVKMNMIKSMERAALKEEENVKNAEERLKEYTALYEEYLERNKRNKVEAFKILNQENKIMLEIHAEILEKTGKLMAIKSDITQYQELLNEYKQYEEFLRLLAPPEWQESENQRRLNSQQAKRREKQKRLSLVLPSIKKETSRSKLMRKDVSRTHDKSPISGTGRQPPRTPYDLFMNDTNEKTEDFDSDEEPELYFTHPQQLLQLYSELEEEYVSQSKNFQEFEERVPEPQEQAVSMQEKMGKKIHIATNRKAFLIEACTREEEKTTDLEQKVDIFSCKEQDRMLSTLNTKVSEVYRTCFGDMEDTLSTLHMLANIEFYVGELCDKLESTPKDTVRAKKIAKRNERIMKSQDEKCSLQMHIRRTIGRAMTESKKKVGRKLMKRSEPPSTKVIRSDAVNAKILEEQLYFFS